MAATVAHHYARVLGEAVSAGSLLRTVLRQQVSHLLVVDLQKRHREVCVRLHGAHAGEDVRDEAREDAPLILLLVTRKVGPDRVRLAAARLQAGWGDTLGDFIRLRRQSERT